MKANSLVSSLLDGHMVTPVSGGDRHRSSSRPITESSLRRLLSESTETGIHLSGPQARTLMGLLERADPFKNGELDTQDVEALGIEMHSDENRGGFIDDDEDDADRTKLFGDREQDERLRKPQPIFGPETAVIAPNATPNHDLAIPPSVLAAMKVLLPVGSFQEFTPAAPTPPPAAPTAGTQDQFGLDNQDLTQDLAPPTPAPDPGVHESVRVRTAHRALEQRQKTPLNEDRPAASAPGGLPLGAIARARNESRKQRSTKGPVGGDPALIEKAKAKLGALGGSDEESGPSLY